MPCLEAAREPVDCATCGERFDRGRRDSRYCSPACRQRAYRREGGHGMSCPTDVQRRAPAEVEASRHRPAATYLPTRGPTVHLRGTPDERPPMPCLPSGPAHRRLALCRLSAAPVVDAAQRQTAARAPARISATPRSHEGLPQRGRYIVTRLRAQPSQPAVAADVARLVRRDYLCGKLGRGCVAESFRLLMVASMATLSSASTASSTRVATCRSCRSAETTQPSTARAFGLVDAAPARGDGSATAGRTGEG